MFKYELGQKAKDKISGFAGIIVARIEFLNGCKRYSLAPEKLKDEKPIDSEYFDEEQIIVKALNKAKKEKEKEGPGGPYKKPNDGLKVKVKF